MSDSTDPLGAAEAAELADIAQRDGQLRRLRDALQRPGVWRQNGSLNRGKLAAVLNLTPCDLDEDLAAAGRKLASIGLDPAAD